MTLYKLSCSGCGCWLITLVIFGLVLGSWTESNLEFWMSYHKGVPVDVPYWLAFLLACVAPLALVANIIAELCKYAI